MRIRGFAAFAAIGVAALGLSACAESINTTVSRYQAMPAPQGQTFFVVSKSDLIASKRAAGRAVDLADVRMLEVDES